MSIRARKNVGVIGLGIIGQRVTDSLRERGFHVFVWNRTPRPVPNFVGSPAEVAELCDLIQIFVSDDEALLQLVQRIARDLGPNHIVMAHCTVSPDTMRAAAEIVGRRGARFLDAPFTGSKGAAENGQLVYYVAGDEASLRQVRPVLEASSKEIIEISNSVGDATTIKVATNMVTAATVQGAAEALALVTKAGLPVEKFAEAMRNNGSNSTTLDMKLPMMMEGSFEAHFSVKHMLKDVVIATRLARVFGLEVGATDTARCALAEEMRHGRADDDYSSLFRQYFPAGVPRKSANPEPVDEEAQPRFAGLDEEKETEPRQETEVAAKSNGIAPTEKLEAEPTAANSPAEETKEKGPLSAEETKERGPIFAEETKEKGPLSAEETKEKGSLPAEETKEKGPLPAEMRAIVMTTDKSPSPSVSAEPQVHATVPPVPPVPPAETPRSKEPGGMWGGFWRRQTDD